MNLQKLSWYINRLKSMSTSEISYRLKQRGMTEKERLANLGRIKSEFSIQFYDDMWEIFHTDKIPFFFSWAERENIRQTYHDHFAENYQATLASADALLADKITIFGQQLDVRHPPDWHQDPLTKRYWDYKFHANIDTRDGKKVGGVKWVWELNRCYHVVTLAKAYFLSDDEKYAQAVCKQITHWIKNNSPYQGVNWTSSLELAIRLINWTMALAFIRQSPALTRHVFETVFQSIHIQSDYIINHLSAHSSANNHLIGELAGLAIIGISFPYLPNSQALHDTGLFALIRETERQIYSDGVPTEQATHYLAFSLDFSLLAWRLAELNEIRIPEMLLERITVACHFIRTIMDKHGNVPSIGDSDDAWVVRLNTQSHANHFTSILNTVSIIVDNPDWQVMDMDEKTFWLMGEKCLITEKSETAPQTFTSHAFKEGGYCVMRHDETIITFDCGELGYLTTAAHGHADNLNVIINRHDKPLLIDPNTYAYHEGYEWRDYFRGTAAHNTIVIDEQNQSEMRGAFLWGRKANTKLLHWESTSEHDFAIAEHDGYKHLGVTHRRSVFFHKPDWLVIADDILGTESHIFEQFWHLPQNCSLVISDDYAIWTPESTTGITMFWDASELNFDVHKGQISPIQGWLSNHYGHIEPAYVLRLHGETMLPIRLVNVCYLGMHTMNAQLYHKKEQVLDIFREKDKLNGTKNE
ncbi:MAG: hypothetical protein B6242_05660 [Anaerolineaceae bacterium 4572_78]|nr:MAG: hypothetical protein B6242_05660 [Anaerolineaceae bacterium 4572_78]